MFPPPWVIGVPTGTALALLALRHKKVFRRLGGYWIGDVFCL